MDGYTLIESLPCKYKKLKLRNFPREEALIEVTVYIREKLFLVSEAMKKSLNSCVGSENSLGIN